MQKPDYPIDEKERQEELNQLEILDTDPEQSFDDLTILASQICGTKISLISLIDRERQWFKSRTGLNAEETPREISWCGHAILGNDIFEVPDATIDDRFKDNPLLLGEPNVRFYAGVPLVTENGYKIGTLCVIDNTPKELSPWQREVLHKLGKQAVILIEARLREKKLIEANLKLEAERKLSLHQAKLASIGQLASGVAHEINNPLAIIKGYLSVIKDTNNLNSETLVRIEKIDNACNRIKTIVNGLRTFSRSDMEEIVRFNLREVLKESIDLVSEIYLKENISLNLEINQNDEAIILGNKGRLSQVIMNLLANAKDANSKMTDRKINVSLKIENKHVILKVQDNGKGIDESISDKIFDPFFTTKDVNEGTGIGLSIVSSIVKEHDGQIAFETFPNQGTTFTIKLPLDNSTGRLSKEFSTPSITTGNINLKILIVDDEEDFRGILKILLNKSGMETVLVSNGADALHALKTQTFDLILTDLQMPILNGPKLIHEVRADLTIKQPKIIIMTGGVDDKKIEDIEKDNSVDGFIYKPFSDKALYSKLEEIFPDKDWDMTKR